MSEIKIGTHKAECTVVEIAELPEVDRQYHHVVLRIDGQEFVMSGTNAQHLGNRLRVAGGWTGGPYS